MDAATLSCSRRLPAAVMRALEELKDGDDRKFLKEGKVAAHLLDCGFAIVTSGDKMVTLAITGAGENALERQERGVDPYLRMTA